MTADIVILGVFVADTAYRAQRQPKMGETLLANSFALGPGGKGSNQAVAAARAGGRVAFISKLGQDTFADMAQATWRDAGVIPLVQQDAGQHSGAAYIFIDEATGDNAILISPGAAASLSPADIEAQAAAIGQAKVFVTQLEQPLDAALRGLEIARAQGVTTILNPAPAADLPDSLLACCDYLTPNESESEALTGVTVNSVDSAIRAAKILHKRGIGSALITLGAAGALLYDGERAEHFPSLDAGPVVETTGAGDAFNGGLAVALAEGKTPREAVRFANAVAALSVTRQGTAPSMPRRGEVDTLLAARCQSKSALFASL